MSRHSLHLPEAASDGDEADDRITDMTPVVRREQYSPSDESKEDVPVNVLSRALSMQEDDDDFVERTPVRITPPDDLQDKYKALLVGTTMDREGVIYTHEGMALGRSIDGFLTMTNGSILGKVSQAGIASMSYEEEEDQDWLLPPNQGASDTDAIAQLLRIPIAFDDLREMGGAVTLENYASQSKMAKVDAKKKKRHIVSLMDGLQNQIREPREGLYPRDVDEVVFEMVRQSTEYLDFTPTFYTRKKILHPSQLPHHKVCSTAAMFLPICNREVDGSVITFLWIDNLRKEVDNTVLENLGKYLKLTPNLEVLGLRGSKLRHLNHLYLPHLLLLELSHNSFKEMDAILHMLSPSKKLRELSLRHNPICKSSQWEDGLPTIKNVFWKVILRMSHIEKLNGKVIPNEMRTEAAARYCSEAGAHRNALVAYNVALNHHLVQNGLVTWEPYAIEKLELTYCGLRSFHVGMMKKLQHLNLSHNSIQTLVGAGLEQCSHLSYLNLSHNSIVRKDNEKNPLQPLELMPRLRQLFLKHNTIQDYHASVIYLTRNLRGTNRSPGLIELDGKRITIEERVAAIHFINSNVKPHRIRWTLNLLYNFGALQMRSVEQFYSKLRELKLVNRHLKEVYLSDFFNLESLDLSCNSIVELDGIERLKQLRVLNVSENPTLNVKKTLLVMSTVHRNIESIDLTPYPHRPNERLFHQIADALLLNNRRLESVNNNEISVDKRVSFFKKHDSKFDVHKYKLHLAVCISAVGLLDSYHYKDVLPGMQYNPTDLTELLNLDNMHITSKSLQLTPFTNLKKLNLADNDIDDLAALGLQNMTQLRWLDVRNNKIRNSASQIGGLIDRLVSLEVLALRGNPCMHNKRDRMAILKSITRVKNLECGLLVLDTEITLSERMQAWSKEEDKRELSDAAKCKAAIALRKPDYVSLKHLLGLDLSNLNLQMVDLSGMSKLRKLKLNGNKLETLRGSGISTMKDLTVLDLRFNELNDSKELVQVLNNLRHLQFLGLEGNQYPSNIRQVLLRSLNIVKTVENRLKYLDNTVLTLAEIVDAAKEEFIDKEQGERFKWDLALRRELTPSQVLDADSIQTLVLQDMSLTYILLTWFPSLVSLDLSGNHITYETLQNSGVEHLAFLKHIDLSRNRISRLRGTAELLSEAASIRSVSLLQNRCFQQNTQKLRLTFLKAWKGIGSKSFQLHTVNGMAVSVEERIEAVESALSLKQAQEIKLEHILAAQKADIETRVIYLASMQLSFVTALAPYHNLEELDLSNNNIQSLAAQNLHLLVSLKRLDISNNKIESLTDLVSGLTKCHRLDELHMLQATRDNESKRPEKFVHVVGKVLRGVKRIQDLENPYLLTKIQHDASQWLLDVCGIGPNEMCDVDLTDKDLHRSLFFIALMAIREIGRVKTMKASGNQWSNGKKRIRGYRQYVIYAAGNELMMMDNEEILDAERLNAIEMVVEEEENDVRHFPPGGWTAVRSEAYRLWKQYASPEAKKTEIRPETVEDGYRSANHVQNKPSATKTDPASDSASKQTALKSIAGSFLNKLEIVINFMQIYTLVLLVDVDIPWPDALISFSVWMRYISLDIDWIFDINVPHKEETKFGVLMTVPLFFLLIYTLSNRVNLQKWKDQYGENWGSTHFWAFMRYLFSVAIVLAYAFIVSEDFFSQLFSGETPDSQTASVTLSLIIVITIIYVLWYLMVRNFRKHYVGIDSRAFDRWWLERLHFVRRFSLFTMTILFMPVARVILLQFQCETVDGERRLVVFPERTCMDESVYAIQVLAIIFAILYFIGLPWFFRFLIRQAVSMIDSHGYEDEKSACHKALHKLESKYGVESEEYKEKKMELDQHLSKYYYNEVRNNKIPQRYIYAAYEKKFRDFKVYQMFQKLCIVVVAMFIPSSITFPLRVVLSIVLVAAFALVSVIFQPFNDDLEDLLDIVSQCTNTASILFGLLLIEGAVDARPTSILLIMFNATAITVFAYALLGKPLIDHIRKRRHPSYRPIQDEESVVK